MDDWIEEAFEDRTRFGLKVERRLHAVTTPFQTVEVVDTVAFGRVLVLDGVFQTSEADEHVYHEMLVHPALCTAPSVRRVLIVGGGDGGTAREVLRHPDVHTCVMVEIDREVVEASRRHLPSVGTAWDDPRLDLRFGDGIEFVRTTEEEPFDVVLLDGSDPVGPSEGLFDRSFYEGCRRVLRDGGVFAAQSESPFLTPDLFRDVVRTVGEVFGYAAPALATVPLYSAGPWSFTLASSRPVPAPLIEARAATVESGCRYWNRQTHAAAYALPTDTRTLLG